MHWRYLGEQLADEGPSIRRNLREVFAQIDVTESILKGRASSQGWGGVNIKN